MLVDRIARLLDGKAAQLKTNYIDFARRVYVRKLHVRPGGRNDRLCALERLVRKR